MNKTIPPLLLVFTLLLGESYLFCHTPEIRLRDWFLLSNIRQDIEWYVKDSSECLTWLIFLGVWWYREKARNKFWSWLIRLFFLFRLVDFVAYWVNHRHAGLIYFFCYLTIIIYVTRYIITIKFNRYKNETGS